MCFGKRALLSVLLQKSLCPRARSSTCCQHTVIMCKARTSRGKISSPGSQAGLLPFVTFPKSPKGSFLHATLEPSTELPATFPSQCQSKFFLPLLCFLPTHILKYTLHPIFFLLVAKYFEMQTWLCSVYRPPTQPPPYVMKNRLQRSKY